MGIAFEQYDLAGADDDPMITRRTFIAGSSGLIVAGRARARPIIMDINALFPQTKAIIAAFSPAPTNARIAAINSCVGLLLRSGLWSVEDVLYMTAAANTQNASIEWKNPGMHSLVAVGSLTFVADRGYTSDGSTGYLTTGYAPSTAGGAFTQDSAHIGAWIANNVAANGQDITINAADFAQASAGFNARTSGNLLRGAVNDLTAVTLSNPITDSSGCSGISRVGPNTSQGFKGPSLIGIIDTTASVSIAAGNLSLCGTPMYALGTKQIAAGFIGGGLISTQVASLNAALFSYMHAVGVA